jgi:hypothetical protein
VAGGVVVTLGAVVAVVIAGVVISLGMVVVAVTIVVSGEFPNNAGSLTALLSINVVASIWAFVTGTNEKTIAITRNRDKIRRLVLISVIKLSFNK